MSYRYRCVALIAHTIGKYIDAAMFESIYSCVHRTREKSIVRRELVFGSKFIKLMGATLVYLKSEKTLRTKKLHRPGIEPGTAEFLSPTLSDRTRPVNP